MFFFFKQKTAYEMCGRDWSSDVCSSDLLARRADLDPEFAKKFLNFIIAEVIQHHKEHQS